MQRLGVTWAKVAATLGVVAALAVIPGSSGAQTAGDALAETPGNFVAMTPVRVVDTRPHPGIQPGETTTTAFPVPATATAVLLNVTADSDATAASYITVWPTGQPQPNTSVINPRPGQVTAGSILVPLGDQHEVSFFNQAGSVSLIVDLEGYVLPVATPKGPDFGFASAAGPVTLPVGQMLPGRLVLLAKVTMPGNADYKFLVSADVSVTAGSGATTVTCAVFVLPMELVENDIDVIPLSTSVDIGAGQTESVHIGAAIEASVFLAPVSYGVACSTSSGPAATAGRVALSFVSIGARLQS
jgi:hypothetical protein